MAVVWLNSNISSWNVSAFDYWDEATQSIQPYGQIPQAGDIFYLNGFNITNINSILLDDVIITNGDNEYTGRNGGAFSGFSNYTIRCKELNIFNTIISATATNNAITLNINAAINLLGSGNLYPRGGVGAINVNINGNVFRNNIGSSVISGNNQSGTFTINGNFETYKPIGTHINFVLNGNVTVHNTGILTQNASNLTINGDIVLDGCRLANFNIGLLNVNGASLTYDGDIDPLKGLLPSNTLNILNPNYTVNRIGDNILYSAIFTKYTMNNRQQYPPENEVKEGTEYVWGEKVGTYQQPPESVVLKDYVYDNGERTGTLENEVTVNVGCTNPQDVRKDIPLANMGIVGTMVIPTPENVLEGTIYDNGTEGTLESQSTADYPAVDKVLIGTSYDHDNMTGTLEPGGDNPQESDVRFGVTYNHNLNTGKAHIPSSQDVRKNVPIEDTVGQIVIPRTSEVKKDVEFDIDSVGTMESVIETNNTINVYRKK